eukprot:scaffold13502_cov70-Phaeocystis_antarctica.AAC.8
MARAKIGIRVEQNLALGPHTPRELLLELGWLHCSEALVLDRNLSARTLPELVVLEPLPRLSFLAGVQLEVLPGVRSHVLEHWLAPVPICSLDQLRRTVTFGPRFDSAFAAFWRHVIVLPRLPAAEVGLQEGNVRLREVEMCQKRKVPVVGLACFGRVGCGLVALEVVDERGDRGRQVGGVVLRVDEHFVVPQLPEHRLRHHLV